MRTAEFLVIELFFKWEELKSGRSLSRYSVRLFAKFLLACGQNKEAAVAAIDAMMSYRDSLLSDEDSPQSHPEAATFNLRKLQQYCDVLKKCVKKCVGE